MLQDLILLVRRQFNFKRLTTDDDFVLCNPLGGIDKIFLIVHESEGLIQAEELQFTIFFLFQSFLQKEIGHLLVKLLYILWRQKLFRGLNQCHVKCVDYILVRLIHHLSQKNWQACRRINDLLHHHYQLAGHASLVQLVFNGRKIFLEVPNRLIIHQKNAIAMIIRIEENCLWHLSADHAWYIGQFFVLDDCHHFFKFLVLFENANIN